MSRLTTIIPKFVETIEEPLDHASAGILYVSEKYSVAICLCPCGCGQKTVLPFKPAAEGKQKHYWMYYRYGDLVTFEPSIANYKNACPNKAHFYIRQNRIDWC